MDDLRFNLHCHVFNLKAVFSKKTQHIIAQRVLDAGFSTGVAQLVVKVITGLLKGPEAIEKIQQLIDPHQHNDFLEFLKVALLEEMDEVTNWLLGQLEPDVIVTPLMMDITTPDANDGAFFQAQTDSTLRQMYRFPGRVLPFFAFNPLRPDAMTRLENAWRQGFVGMKLYPSLGYDIRSAVVERAVRFCAERDMPIMQHCSKGGFYATRQDRDNSLPTYWATYLQGIPGLKLCLGHFGGEGDFVTPGSQNNWTDAILKMMALFNGHEDMGTVYADVAYHTTGMPPNAPDAYKERLKSILEEEGCRPYVLWGTDSFLVRQRVTEREYWDNFLGGLIGDDDFHEICSLNAMEYMGFHGRRLARNLSNYVKVMRANSSLFDARQAAPWLRERL
ncbi:amidohydrolase family protein [Fundidesulfovibrio agrisoli]|uniref:amidohydrolase family protein n=1 Tax=Fundidesulfovibrio agrisoli TaxID=2922717 RepID=UPI001FABB97A|nr:amidohydrolase family protein [Fundidesulfovibrio agrisoli]